MGGLAKTARAWQRDPLRSPVGSETSFNINIARLAQAMQSQPHRNTLIGGSAMTIPAKTLLSLAVFSLAAGTAHADQRALSANGTGLAVDSPCARSVTIEPDPQLHGRVDVTATATHAQELAQLTLTSTGNGARLGIPEGQSCWRPVEEVEGITLGLANNFKRTLDITIRVPSGAAVSVEESSTAHYALGAIGGPLNLDISGQADLTAASATTIKADLSGGGAVTIGMADGALSLNKSGSAVFRVNGGKLAAAKLDLSGSGDVILAVSGIDALSLENSGSAKVTLSGSVDHAALSLSGSGDVQLNAANIAVLSLESSGSASVRVSGAVGTASLDVSGSGDVWLGRVTGTLSKDSSGSGEIHIGAN
jgi:hypothetical protein